MIFLRFLLLITPLSSAPASSFWPLLLRPLSYYFSLLAWLAPGGQDRWHCLSGLWKDETFLLILQSKSKTRACLFIRLDVTNTKMRCSLSESIVLRASDSRIKIWTFALPQAGLRIAEAHPLVPLMGFSQTIAVSLLSRSHPSPQPLHFCSPNSRGHRGSFMLHVA